MKGCSSILMILGILFAFSIDTKLGLIVLMTVIVFGGGFGGRKR